MKNKNVSRRGVVVYESKYGATRQYAEWLGDKLKLPVIMGAEIKADQLNSCDFLLIGTPVYTGKFRIKNWMKKNVKILINKKLFLFIVNATAPGEQAKRNQFIQDNVPAEIRQYSEVYFLPGRLIHKNLTFFDRLMLKMAEKTIKDPEKRKAIQSDLDGIKKDNLVPLIKAVNDFSDGKHSLSPASAAHSPELFTKK